MTDCGVAVRSLVLLALLVLLPLLGFGIGVGMRVWKTPPPPAPASSEETIALSDRPAEDGDRTVAPAAVAMADLFSVDGPEQLRRWAFFLARAEADEVEALARHLDEQGLFPENTLFFRLVFARWTELAPEAALAFCRKTGRSIAERDRLLEQVFEAWGRVDLDPALAAANHPWERVAVVAGAAARDPERGFQALERDDAVLMSPGSSGPWSEIIECLVRADPVRTAAVLERWPKIGRQPSVAAAWAKTDPAAALAWLAHSRMDPTTAGQSLERLLREASPEILAQVEITLADLPPGPFRHKLLTEWIKLQARQDPAAALDATLARPRGYERLAGLAAVALSAGEARDWPMVIRVAEAMHWQNPGSALNPFANTILEAGAGTFASQDEVGKLFDDALLQMARDRPAEAWSIAATREGVSLIPRDILASWLRADADGAARSLTEATAPRSEHIDLLAREWATLDPAASWRYWESLAPEHPQRLSFLAGLMKTMGAQDPEEGWRRLQAMADGNSLQRSTAHLAFFNAWLQADAPGMAREVARQPELREDPQTVSNLMQTLGRTDPQAALSLLEYLPENNHSGILSLAQSLTKQDPQAASEWVASLPAGGRKDQAIDGMVRYLLNLGRDLPAAWAWGETVQAPETRQRVLDSVLTEWNRHDPAAARAAVEASALSAEEKAALLTKP